MSTLVTWLRSFFGDRDLDRPFRFQSIEWREVDIDKTSEFLGLSKLAEENGSKELPPSTATQLDGPQRTIIQHIKGRVNTILSGYEVTLKGIDKDIERIDVRHRTSLIRDLAKRLIEKLRDIDDEFLPQLTEIASEYRRRDDELSAFRHQYNLRREPDYPDSHFYHLAVAAAVVILEAALNAFFFRQGMLEGYVGGAVLAFLLALVDVVFVFFLGRLGARWFSPRTWQKFAGLVCWLVFAAWALMYNLLTAHVREQLGSGSEIGEASRLALEGFKQSPFGLEQLDSWVLFAFGAVFSILAVATGFKWDDQVPGYGRVDRLRKEVLQEFRYFVNNRRNRALELRDHALAELDSTLKAAHVDVATLRSKVETKDAILKAVGLCVKHYEDSCEALIHLYRDRNQAARSTPAPAHFDERVVPQIETPGPYSTDRDHEKLESQERDFEGVMSLARQIRSDINHIYRRFLEVEIGDSEIRQAAEHQAEVEDKHEEKVTAREETAA